METKTFQPLTDEVRKILTDHHKDAVTESDCARCSSACCSQGGAAIFENVLLIYDLYS